MSKPQWNFIKTRPGRARESEIEKFFKSEASTGPTALVREGIQNSLDAALDRDVPVNVRIVIGRTTSESIAPFCTGLWEHVHSPRVAKHLTSAPNKNDDVHFLAFEDFNTTGLWGNHRQWCYKPDEKNPFFNFFRGEGVTDKGDSQRGRHGVGKMVFTVASRAHCIFGVTSTKDSSPVLMGTSTLWLHNLGSTEFDPDGWFGHAERLDGIECDLTLPVSESSIIEKFCSVFRLDRENIPGLSIVVPWIDENYKSDDLIRAVVEGFFWPILRKELNVEIVNGDQRCIIDAGTIEPLAAGLQGDAKATVRFAKWALSSDQRHPVLPAGITAQRWVPELITPETLTAIHAGLDAGDNVAIRVPINIRKTGDKTGDCTWFDVFLQRDSDCHDGSIRFIRNGLLIAQVPARRSPGYRALVVAEENVISKFLGDAENPAHTEWQHENVRGSYFAHRAALDFVITSVQEIRKYLSKEQKKADPTALLDLFYLPKKTEAEQKPTGKKPKQPKGGESDSPELEIKSKPKRWQVHKKSNGFVLGRGDVKAERPRYLDIRAAYGVRRGSPFKRYREADFNLDSKGFQFDSSGLKILKRDSNRIFAEVTDDDFRIEVIGFDANRDVHLQVKPQDEPSDDGAET